MSEAERSTARRRDLREQAGESVDSWSVGRLGRGKTKKKKIAVVFIHLKYFHYGMNSRQRINPCSHLLNCLR